MHKHTKQKLQVTFPYLKLLPVTDVLAYSVVAAQHMWDSKLPSIQYKAGERHFVTP